MVHIYLVHGVCNIECGLVLGGLRDAGFPESRVTEFMQSFNWPAQTAGSSPKKHSSGRQRQEDFTVKGLGIRAIELRATASACLFYCLYVGMWTRTQSAKFIPYPVAGPSAGSVADRGERRQHHGTRVVEQRFEGI